MPVLIAVQLPNHMNLAFLLHLTSQSTEPQERGIPES